MRLLLGKLNPASAGFFFVQGVARGPSKKKSRRVGAEAEERAGWPCRPRSVRPLPLIDERPGGTLTARLDYLRASCSGKFPPLAPRRGRPWCIEPRRGLSRQGTEVLAHD